MDWNAAAWGYQNPKAGIIVGVFCPVKHPPHCVAEIQVTPHGRLLKVYLRDELPKAPIAAPRAAPSDDVSHLVNNPGYRYLVKERRARPVKRGLRESFRAYNAESFPADWERTVICRCTPGTITGVMLTEAIEQSRHATRPVVVRFNVGTR